MTWTKLGDEFGPESAGLTDAEFRTHVEALIYSNWRLLDLHVPKSEVRRFAGSADAEAAVDGLVVKGWWDDRGDAWHVGVRFGEWQRDRAQVEARRAYLAEAQRRSRSHKAGDHSLCLPGRCSLSTVDSTVDPGRVGSGTTYPPDPLDQKQGQGQNRDAPATESTASGEAAGLTPLPSPNPGDDNGPGQRAGRDQHILAAVHLQSPAARGNARGPGGRPPLPAAKRQAILTLHATGGLNLTEIAQRAGVAKSTAHKVIHEAAS